MTRRLKGPRAAADYLGTPRSELQTWRRHHGFPDPDARIGVYPGWSDERLDRFHEENMAQVRRLFAEPGGRLRPPVNPPWWTEPATVRYLSITDLSQATGLARASMSSHYYKGGLADPDVTIGHKCTVAGWTIASARDLADAHGWHLDLARVADTSGLGEAP